MVPPFDSSLFNKKSIKKFLTVSFDDGENILDCLEQAMIEHNLRECRVERLDGTIKTAKVNFFEGGKFGASTIKNKPIMAASGNFKLSGGDLWGSMNICTSEKKPLSCTFVTGLASENLQLKVSFVEIVK